MKLAICNCNVLPSLSVGLTGPFLPSTSSRSRLWSLVQMLQMPKFWLHFRGPISWGAKAVGTNWPSLAGKLDSEGENPKSSCTEALKASLQRNSYSRENWLDIKVGCRCCKFWLSSWQESQHSGFLAQLGPWWEQVASRLAACWGSFTQSPWLAQ